MEAEHEQEVHFEDDLRTLETLVDELERDDASLATALARYEQGVKLLVRCQAALEQAERSVALLTGVNADGTPATAPFDASATAANLGTISPSPAEAPTRTRKRAATPRPAPEPRDDDGIPF